MSILWTMTSLKPFHLKPGSFGSSRVSPLAASQIHQAYFADLEENIMNIICQPKNLQAYIILSDTGFIKKASPLNGSALSL